MATNEQIKLNITSAFDPGGFSKANRAVGNLGNEMKKGSKVAGDLMNALGSADGAVGNFAVTLNKLGSAFKGGGGIALAAAGIGLLISKFYEAKEAVIKFGEEQRKAFRDDLLSKMESSLESMRSKHSDISDQMERSVKAATAISKAYDDLAKASSEATNAEADLIAARLEGEKQTKMSMEEDPVKKKAIELDFERQILKAKQDAAKQDRETRVKAAYKKENEAQESVDTEISRRKNLRNRKKDLESFLETSKNEGFRAEYQKSNPMPKDPGVLGTLFDGSTYQRAMDEWIAGWEEFDSANKRKIEVATQDLKKTNADIELSASSIKQKYIERGVARKERASTVSKSEAEDARGNIDQNKLSLQQIAFDKTMADYQSALEKRVKVEEEITKKEEEIAKLKKKENDREDKRNQWNQQATQATQLGAAGWNQQQTAATNAQEATDKGTKHEGKWVANAKQRMSTGAKLSKGEMARIANFEDWNKLQGPNPFDPAKAAAAQIKRMDDSLKELQKLNANLDNALKVN